MTLATQRKPLIGLTCSYAVEDARYYLAAEYSSAVSAAGGASVQIPLLPDAAADIAARLDGIVLCGSPSDVEPARYGRSRQPEVANVNSSLDETCCRLLEHAFSEKKPVLAICYGVQVLNVFLGGTLIQHIPAAVDGALEHRDPTARHGVALEAGSQFATWAGDASEIFVNSTHHQAIEQSGRGLRVAGCSADGVIEAIEGQFPGHFVVGVQWHPERIWKEEAVSRQIFSELMEAASQGQANFLHTGGRASDVAEAR